MSERPSYSAVGNIGVNENQERYVAIGRLLYRFLIEFKNVAFEMCFGRDRTDVVHCSGALPTLSGEKRVCR
jgi:hypothetical protein